MKRSEGAIFYCHESYDVFVVLDIMYALDVYEWVFFPGFSLAFDNFDFQGLNVEDEEDERLATTGKAQYVSCFSGAVF